MPQLVTIRVQEADFDIAQEITNLRSGGEDVGAVVAFVGVCRADDGGVALDLEHCPGMVELQIARHLKVAISRWPLTGVTLIHRTGRVHVGENIVLVLAGSAHRAAAFEAADFLMDYLKTQAPFWKRADTAPGPTWIDADGRDEAVATRWFSRPEKTRTASLRVLKQSGDEEER